MRSATRRSRAPAKPGARWRYSKACAYAYCASARRPDVLMSSEYVRARADRLAKLRVKGNERLVGTNHLPIAWASRIHRNIERDFATGLQCDNPIRNKQRFINIVRHENHGLARSMP